MQSPASDNARSTDRYVARLSGALAALLGRRRRASRGRVAGLLRAQGLITYPPPLLGGLLERLPDVLAAKVLPRLDCADLALFRRMGPSTRAALVASGQPRAGANEVPLKVRQFVRSVERLAWAKANDCPWVAMVCALVAGGGVWVC